jgi:predicted DNA-binding protein YlxM (UPF0122 family)
MRMNNSKYPWPINVIRLVVDTEGDLPFVITPKCGTQLMAALNYLSGQSATKKRRVDMLLAYYKHGKSMSDIGSDFGVSKSIVSLEIRQCICHLRHPNTRQKFMPLLITIDEIDEYYKKKMAELDEREARLDARQRKLNAKEGILDIKDMGLSVRAYNCLTRAGMETSKDIEAAIKSGTLAGVRNLGRKSYDQILERMDELFGTHYSEEE